jgi:PadR family transcriptional regulator PadR
MLPNNDEVFDNLRLELRRGCLILAVLATLRTEQYGYTLRKLLAEHGLAVDEGTLYPLLRRLESQGLLMSEWREAEKRNKRFYQLSSEGHRILVLLLAEWQAINASISAIAEPVAQANAPKPEIAQEVDHGFTQSLLAGR